MKVYHGIENLNIERSVVTVGSFDGVHCGHRELLQRLNDLSRQYNAQSIVVTFWPHPRQVLNINGNTPLLLNTIDEKLSLLEKAGIDGVVLFPFDHRLSQMQANDFIREMIIGKLNAHCLVAGQDHHFGKNRSGNATGLSDIVAGTNIRVEVVDLKMSDQKISSSVIRKALLSGDLQYANTLLGYEYMISGKIIRGNQLGRTIGFPTANISPPDYKLIPNEGVYRVKVCINESCSGSNSYLGMMCIGKRLIAKQPDETKHIEVNIFDFDGKIYDRTVTLSLTHRIRNNIHFDNMTQLEKQLHRDKQIIVQM